MDVTGNTTEGKGVSANRRTRRRVLLPWGSDSAKDPLPASAEQLSPEHNALPQPAHEAPLSPVTVNEDGGDLEDGIHPRDAKYHLQTRQPSAQIDQMDAEHSQLFQESKAAIRRLENELTRYRTRIKQQEVELSHRDAVIWELRSNLAQIQDKHQKLEDIVVARQENALQSMVANNGYIPKEDQSIRDELSNLTESIRSWARKNCLISFADLEDVPETEKDMVIRQLTEYCSQPDWNTTMREISIPQNKIPMVLLHALLAKDLFEQIFTDPFFAFPKIDGDHTIFAAGYFQSIYRIMIQVRGLVTRFLNSSARTLLRNVENHEAGNQRAQELQSLYDGAAQLALSLWTQRAFMTCQSLEELPPFTVSNPIMRAHRLHRLDEDDKRLDGKRILLCVQPAILAFGSENAEHYNQHKIWSPAVVVVREK
ncbi:uncharacterized protein NFIA_102270 [Aspergillus fischeri NRRL 181]|uniref:Uncharacterized protein n=1 Tax=Neosartorya fischeri (strain ATCC 1020 / DSM 3700 / CBS 544.65 / FGSC A1164 / JCM 1740 / NRRL 181 / WB 181) TaxID=331117 RepID=A1CVU1_NEOFI|nr:conserved hypothetical protein [Aspergillus fischeri NRRL 181]EAW24743.1 conserved hypothetical protein [Aspergillus fischeri NRRL 181]